MYPGFSTCLTQAAQERAHYLELAAMANSLCKSKGGNKGKTKARL